MSTAQTQSWTPDQIDRIPSVYKDFMLALREVVDSESRPIKVSGIPIGRIESALRALGHPYDATAVAEKLEEKQLVSHNDFGFYQPTSLGKKLIQGIVGTRVPESIPPFPDF